MKNLASLTGFKFDLMNTVAFLGNPIAG